MPREDVSRYLGAGEMMPDGTPRSGLSQGAVTEMLYERLAYLQERDEAQAQVQALTETLHEIARMSYDVQYQVDATRSFVRFASHVHHLARHAVEPPEESPHVA